MEYGSILKDEYTVLRAEICQSIAQQHHIMLTGYGAIAAVIGFSFGSNGLAHKALFVVPMLTIAMVALWAVECNRMVRASYYIAYILWPKLCRECKGKSPEGWESWVRIEEGPEGRFRLRQHKLQQIVWLYMPILIGASSMVLAGYYATSEHPGWWFVIVVITLVSAVFWYYLWCHIKDISDLGAEKLELEKVGFDEDPNVNPGPSGKSAED